MISPILFKFVSQQSGFAFFGAWLRSRTFLFGVIAVIVTFCGHSQYAKNKQDEDKILSILSDWVGECPAALYLGGYGAFDAFARECGRKFQLTHPHIKLVFVTPYITASYQKNHLESKKELYDEIVYAELENVPMKFAISHRNKWMVEKADLVIACIDHAWGGAYQTYNYAKRKQKPIFNIANKEL